jgi:hypothetical protein
MFQIPGIVSLVVVMAQYSSCSGFHLGRKTRQLEILYVFSGSGVNSEFLYVFGREDSLRSFCLEG